ncbi:hypothetical protein ACT89R_01695 [Rhodococcus qingshengii]
MAGFTCRIAIKRPADIAQGRYNQRKIDWSSIEPVDVPDLVSVQPAANTESGAAEMRSTQTIKWKLFTQPGLPIDIRSTDRVIWLGNEYDVDEVLSWPDPYIENAIHHVEAILTKVTG